MTFQHLTKDKEVYEYHYFISDTFQITEPGDKNEIEILDDFIKSDYFTDDYSFEREISIEYPNHGPFNLKGILTTDFKTIKPEDIEKAVDNLSLDDDWADDLKYFKELWSRAKGRVAELNMTNGTIFHINKHWFKSGDKQLVMDWDYVFIYYLTFIYISTDSKKLVCFDLGYD